MKSRPNILITNDDGINALGIRHLWNSLKDIANITIIAPSEEQSGVGLGITIRNPLRIEKVDGFGNTAAWKVSGTPADCVKMALSVILDSAPNLIVSGINRGTNAGRNLLYSGTVAGVIEGVMHDIPGIAFSCTDYFNTNYVEAENYIPGILRHVLECPLSKGTLLNVNFPVSNAAGIQGVRMTRQGKEFLVENPDKRQHPAEGHEYYWLGTKWATFEEEEDSDIMWLRKGYVAAVPVHVHELTDHQHLNTHKAHLAQIFPPLIKKA